MVTSLKINVLLVLIKDEKLCIKAYTASINEIRYILFRFTYKGNLQIQIACE